MRSLASLYLRTSPATFFTPSPTFIINALGSSWADRGEGTKGAACFRLSKEPRPSSARHSRVNEDDQRGRRKWHRKARRDPLTTSRLSQVLLDYRAEEIRIRDSIPTWRCEDIIIFSDYISGSRSVFEMRDQPQDNEKVPLCRLVWNNY